MLSPTPLNRRFSRGRSLVDGGAGTSGRPAVNGMDAEEPSITSGGAIDHNGKYCLIIDASSFVVKGIVVNKD